MAFRSILVHADNGAGVEARIRLAAALAKRNNGGLIGAAARLPAPLVQVYAGGAAMVSAGLMDASDDATRAAFKAAETAFNEIVAGMGIETEWRAVIDFPALAIAGMGSAADLLVAGQSSVTESFDVGDLVMKAGRPVLIVPAEVRELDTARILVAWKNTGEARRALADSLPFLKEAKAVHLLHVGEAGEEAAGIEDAGLFLRRHGIEPSIEVASPNSHSSADHLVGAARQRDCGLMVLGAYGHSRLREWMFGGVTHDFLHSAPLPCLFSR